MPAKGYIIVLSTTATRTEGVKIARAVLAQRLAACVSVVGGVQSYFWWKGRVRSAAEWMLLVKTRRCHLPRIRALIKKMHSYELPECVAVPIIGGSPAFLRWISDSVTSRLRGQT